GVSDRGRRSSRIRPASCSKLIFRARDVEIGDGNKMHAPDRSDLAEKHGAELAGTDQADRDRTSGRLALEQHGMEVHVILIGDPVGWAKSQFEAAQNAHWRWRFCPRVKLSAAHCHCGDAWANARTIFITLHSDQARLPTLRATRFAMQAYWHMARV